VPGPVTVTAIHKCGHDASHVIQPFSWSIAPVSQGEISRVTALVEMTICADCVAANAAAAEELRAECETHGTRCYVRYGKLPGSGQSWNSADRRAEAGISAYAAYRLPGARYVIDPGACCFSAIWLRDRAPYLVSGTLLDERGSDGEPLLADATARRLPRTATLEWL